LGDSERNAGENAGVNTRDGHQGQPTTITAKIAVAD
jgi:hypothetical protein